VTTSWSIPSSPPGGPQAIACGPFHFQLFLLSITGRSFPMSNSSRERNQFADRYSQMRDEELIKLALESSHLTDIAWEALEEELERRNLEIPEPEIEQVGSPKLHNLVLLRRFRDIPEALLAKGRLEASGIECFLADENMVRMDWFISNLLGGVKLLVEPSDFSVAARLLNEISGDEIDPDNNEF
jgi:hypothetical protein